MKRYIKYLIPLIIIFILIIVIFIISINGKNTKEKCYDNIDINEIFDDINSFNKDKFMIIDNNKAPDYLPLDYSKAEEYIVATNKETNEFIILIKQLKKSEYNILKQYISNLSDQIKNNGLKYKLIEEKNYVIITALIDENSSFEGILRSYVYCK